MQQFSILVVLSLSYFVLSASISLGAGLIDSLEAPTVNYYTVYKPGGKTNFFKTVLDDGSVQVDQLPPKVQNLIGLRSTLREMILYINHMQHDILISLPQFFQLHG